MNFTELYVEGTITQMNGSPMDTIVQVHLTDVLSKRLTLQSEIENEQEKCINSAAIFALSMNCRRAPFLPVKGLQVIKMLKLIFHSQKGKNYMLN